MYLILKPLPSHEKNNRPLFYLRLVSHDLGFVVRLRYSLPINASCLFW